MTSVDWSSSPLVLAPMAGGPSTVALAAAAADGGVFPFLGGAYLTPERLRDDIGALREATRRPFGVNIFAPSPDSPSMQQESLAYAELLAPWAAAAGIELGHPHYDDDAFDAKVDLLVDSAPAVVSFAFGWPPAEVVARLQSAGVAVWVTVNEATEVEWAQQLGVDGLVVQGWEAGGHRGGPVDTGTTQSALQPLVAEVAGRTSLPVMAAGGVMTGSDAAAVLRAGASAVALGTAFLDCPEAGTAPVHRHALTHRTGTTVTRAFTGRSARALTTTWTELFTEAAPAAYPHVHHLTAPLRAYGRDTGEAELVNLWAGTGHERLRQLPAAELARTLVAELRAAL
ncbi:nitronate monooxygenase [Phycicoccus badiiscoriae]|uniref:Propionate 3-nitronate monooxygenase n=1 Tax=Pedococcus badiiscoriae TaxID=642776 RepID=A0A852WMN8_9MICO|nr:nitronate monooxygenase [Pedococcus badiiscoriae]NYG08084.1 nitronate monooxygenase [Pedococcus badiiscoriae]